MSETKCVEVEGLRFEAGGKPFSLIDVAEWDKAWAAKDCYIGFGGKSLRPLDDLMYYEQFKRWLKENPYAPIQMIRVDFESCIIIDGCHRFAVLRDMGLKQIPAVSFYERREGC
jgi:hypothetical protein